MTASVHEKPRQGVAARAHPGAVSTRVREALRAQRTSAPWAVLALALATTLLAAAQDAGRGRDVGELTRLKPFAAPPPDALSAIAEGTA